MILDSSVLMAVARKETGYERLAFLMQSDSGCIISAATYVELAIVFATRFGYRGSQMVDDLLRGFSVVIEPVTVRQAIAARQAFYQFGKGRHQAGLNFGDCFSYALAQGKNDGLLFVGDDFTLTDIKVAGADAADSARS